MNVRLKPNLLKAHRFCRVQLHNQVNKMGGSPVVVSDCKNHQPAWASNTDKLTNRIGLYVRRGEGADAINNLSKITTII